ncbi:uncharacterized protein KGF55_005502 [Candida pseudojiufengensis]|uniref:uncharacterized protein n=1 Tax=Candida pseudojiufengensis TaxID=497109 RepID=UPI0022254EDE|nr:uncharacterized protein KGF55_005502 [Candida pseudojiufengensis]KAI5959159.1 hypothetical protein KGF55_005502 [Candida pseudojiufengensis]
MSLTKENDPTTPEEEQRLINFKNKPDLTQIYNLYDFEYVARNTIPSTAWNFYSTGADDEISMRENHAAFHRIFFKPRVMVDVSRIDYSTTLLGTRTSAPFYISATGFGKLGHPDGELNLTKGGGKENIIQMIGTLASIPFDEIADARVESQTQWYQLYMNADRELTKSQIQNLEKKGIRGLFITVDAPQGGNREKDMRSKKIDQHISVKGGEKNDRSHGVSVAATSYIDPSLNWSDLLWIKSITSLPILLKGIQCVEDAVLAAQYGCQGIVLTNHGGRQLDFSRAPIEVLIETMPVLREKGLDVNFEVYIDGGIRRGTDVLKALCLGAKGVGLGRPFLYAMSTYGPEGVEKAIQLLKKEIESSMRLLGVTSIDQLGPKYVDISSFHSRSVPADKLYDKVYQPLTNPPFKNSKL